METPERLDGWKTISRFLLGLILAYFQGQSCLLVVGECNNPFRFRNWNLDDTSLEVVASQHIKNGETHSFWMMINPYGIKKKVGEIRYHQPDSKKMVASWTSREFLGQIYSFMIHHLVGF